MKVFALISGGKDSCYNALLCERYGHEIVALGNLLPMEDDCEELDSYMYQTVGHGLIEAYSKCTGLPLFRRKIQGSSVNQQLIYEEEDTSSGDEVEDLMALLVYAKQHMACIEAVASGAIASDYQRSRVERVCARLGLVSLAYMWHVPQEKLLRDMIKSGIEAVIIKVAAAGLYPRKHLGKSIEYIEPELHGLRELYGINVCGEGGEYETLTLDCPLFKRGHIVLDEFEVEVGSPDSLAPVAWLKPVAFHVEMKEELDESDLDPVIYRIPDSFDPRAEGTYIAAHDAAAVHADTDVQADFSFEIGMSRSTKYITFCGECSLREEYTSSNDSIEQLTQERVGAALSELLSRMLLQVDKVGHSLSDSVFVTLYISDMTHFKYLNKVYSEFFPPVNPPSRATIQLANNGRLVVVVEIMCRKQASSSVPKKVLHVQSISSWAPCCIGPYSQGTSYDGLVHFAGQIPLDPITMELIEGDEFQQVDRVLKTCNAVAVGMGVDFDSSLLWSLLYICTEKGDSSDGSKASKILKRIKDHAGEESKNMNSDEFLEEYLKSKKLEHAKSEWSPLCLVLQFPALPRNSMLELQTVHASVESIMYEPPNDSSSSSSEEDQLCDSLGWLSDLKASSLILDESFEVHIESLHSKRQFLKCHLLLNNADLENWKDNDAAALVSLISTELKRAGLSNDSVVFIKLYIHYDGSHLRHTLGLSVKSHLESIAHACTVPVTGIWNNVLAQDCQESAVLCIEIYAKS